MNDTPLPAWDLSDLYASDTDPSLEGDLDAAAARAESLRAAYAGRVAALDADALAALLDAYEAALVLLYRPQMYASLRSATDGLEEGVRALSARVGERATAVGNTLRFVNVELAAADATVFAAWRAAPALSGLGHFLQRARASAPHTLDAPVEAALSTKDLTGRRAWVRLYDELCAGWRFDSPRGDGATGLSLAEVRALREHADRDVRRRAQHAVLDRLSTHGDTLGYIVNTLYQDHRLECTMRGHDDPVGPTLLDDELSRATFDALLGAVEAHYPVAQEFFRLKAKALGLDALESFDLLAPWPGAEPAIAWDEARRLVLDAFGALSPTLRDHAADFFTARRIDAASRPGKRDGAFCAGMIPSVAPRVFVNYNGRPRDVHTLAHELGHGVHFALAGQHQRLLNYWPTSPMAETASVFAEMVLTRALLEGAVDPAARRRLLASRIEEALGTIHRQVSFTRYELEAHAARARGNVPVEALCDLWSAQAQSLYGDAVRRGPLDRWGWAGIPHLIHYRFYCYSYAFGQLLVFALYRLWERDPAAFVPRYEALLAAGGCDTPAALLAGLGVDINDPHFWSEGLSVLSRMVQELQRDA